MRIGELADRAGMSPSAIRFYESSKLLPAATRDANGYRSYSEEALRILLAIQLAQRLGFSLDAIRSVLARDGVWPKETIIEKLNLRLKEIDAMQAALKQQRKEVTAMMDNLNAHWASDDCVAMGSLVEQALAEPGESAQSKRRRAR
jgi:DNA-binding transcriptional MerR regulator